MAITVLAYIAYYQLANVLPIWIQAYVDLDAGGFAIPIEWFYSIDPLASILSVPLLFALWNRQAAGGPRAVRADEDRDRFVHRGSANLILVAAIARFRPAACRGSGRCSFCAMQGVAFMYFWPTLLALVSRAAPPKDQRDDDGSDLPDLVRRQQSDRPDRHLL